MPKHIRMKKIFKHFRVLLILIVSVRLLQSCNDPEIKDDTFAVDVGTSTIPYLIVDTNGSDIQFETKIPAHLQVYEQKTLMQETEIAIEYRGKTSFRLSNKKGYNIETTG